MAETTAGVSGSAAPDGTAAKTWEIEEVEDEFDSVDVDYQNNNNINNKLQSSKLQSSSHEKILSFLQILLPKSAKLGGGGSGNSSAGSTTSGRKSAEKSSKNGGGGKNSKSSSSGLINTTRRSSSAFVLGEENSLLFHKCHSPNSSRQLTDNSPHVKSCTQLQSAAVVGSSTSCASTTSTSGTVAATIADKQRGIENSKATESTGECRCRSAAEVRTTHQNSRHDEGRPIGSGSGHIIIIRSASPTLSHTDQLFNANTTPSSPDNDQQTQEKHYRSFEFIA